ncbi:Glycosyltransferase involved in cell wall bisynthesis [Dyadobacter sp. SG02]|uniref:glycosyltransferase family 2 protein n=1 Tax=Dyadobacter sp. SG02 TaxID=1855291 RepID=UPI0008B3520D|nr:glycosyltransferase family 2 protein [Dyadobacter sp. SG02]SEI45685.1 Glycosyltransferase involved in cell wall bisynthesis [Dyadobacter sp. SG02]
MDNSPLLTIITVTFQAEKYLGRTLSSVEKAISNVKNASQLEYLIIDGGSNDQTLAIANGYSHFISKILSEKDKGLYDAMNKGLRLASGKYVWFLNAGDEAYDDQTLQNLLSSLETGAAVYYSDAMMVREDGTEVGLRSHFTPHTLPANLRWQDFALGMKVCHQAFIARKDIAPPYEYQNLSADIEWEIECLKRAESIQFLPFVLCRYLLGGLSVKNHRRSLTDRYKVLKKHFGLIPTLFNHLRIFWRGYWFAKKNGKYW